MAVRTGTELAEFTEEIDIDPWIPRRLAALAPAEQQLLYVLGTALVERWAAPDQSYRSRNVRGRRGRPRGLGQRITFLGILCGCHHDVHARCLNSAVAHIWMALRIEQIASAHVRG